MGKPDRLIAWFHFYYEWNQAISLSSLPVFTRNTILFACVYTILLLTCGLKNVNMWLLKAEGCPCRSTNKPWSWLCKMWQICDKALCNACSFSSHDAAKHPVIVVVFVVTGEIEWAEEGSGLRRWKWLWANFRILLLRIPKPRCCSSTPICIISTLEGFSGGRGRAGLRQTNNTRHLEILARCHKGKGKGIY